MNSLKEKELGFVLAEQRQFKKAQGNERGTLCMMAEQFSLSDKKQLQEIHNLSVVAVFTSVDEDITQYLVKQQKEEIEANAAAVAPAAASSSSASAPLPASSSSSNTPVPASSCRSCNASFRSADEQHAHYKSSWHCHNLKRKLSGLTSITQLEFHELSASGDISSESESEKEKSGDEGENEKRTARRKNRQLQKQQQQKKSSTEQKLQRDQESDEDEDAEDDEAELSDGSEDEEGISKKGNNAEGDEEEQSHPLTRRSPQLSFLLRSNANNNTLNNVASSSSSSSSSSPSTSNNSSNNNCYVVTVFRSLLGEAEKNFTAAQVEQFYKEQFSALLKQSLSVQPVWVIFMCQGGYFAAAVFEGAKLLRHKTIKRYTTRRKQGGSQASRDKQNAGHTPQSAGAMIRRANEKKLREEIVALMADWKADIDRSTLIWLAAPSHNRAIFVRDDHPVLLKSDKRIRSVPLVTKRPSLLETQRVHKLLSTCLIRKYPEEEIAELMRKQKQLQEEQEKQTAKADEKKISQALSAVHVQAEDELVRAALHNDLVRLHQLLQNNYIRPVPSDAMQLTSPLYVACKENHVEFVGILLEFSKKNKLSQLKFDVNEQIPSERFQTCLHAAVLANNEELVEQLLQHGADPTIRSRDAKTAFSLAVDAGQKKLQRVFQRFAAAHPTAFDYSKANIVPMTDEQEKEREKAKADKLRQKRKQQKERQKIRKKEEEAQKAQEEKLEKDKRELEEVEKSRKAKEANMTDRERRALAAENRLLSSASSSSSHSSSSSSSSVRRCDQCSQPLPLVPFERFEYKYCSTNCVKAHRIVLGK